MLSGYNGGHGISYTDYEGLEGYSSQYEGHAVLPTVAVPVHAVSASPVHVTPTLDHHGYDHHADHGHDYYVSTLQLFIYLSSHFSNYRFIIIYKFIYLG